MTGAYTWSRQHGSLSGPVLPDIIHNTFSFGLAAGSASGSGGAMIGPRDVGASLFGPYLIGVELASMLLLGGLVGAYHLGWRKAPGTEAK